MDHLKQIWRQSPILTATAILMLGDLLVCVIGLTIDPTVITGAPAWLKPAKFAVSTAILTGTLAWIYGFLPRSRKLRWLAIANCAALILEIAIIDLQAARGTASHFNQTTTLNKVLFGIMGTGIGVIWLSMAGMCLEFCRARFTNRSLGWAIRLGMLITTIGSATSGGLMIAPTAPQREAMASHQRITMIGGHTVGGPDGGPGLPGTDWSTEHGDLRIPHFLALHALQAIPFFALLIPARFGTYNRATQLVFTASASYLLLTVLLTWQALRGEPLIHPSLLTLEALGGWFAATVTVALLQLSSGSRTSAVQGAAL